MYQRTRGERLCDEAWAAGDHRPRCMEAGHLVCRGCQTCACTEAPDGLGVSLSTQVRVSTDRGGHTWCQECRYEVNEYGNWRDGVDTDDRSSAHSWRYHRMLKRSRVGR